MSEDSTPDSAPAAVKKKSIISLPFAIIAVVVLGAGAFFGKDIMTWVMLQQEAAKAGAAPVEPEEYAGLSQLAKSLQSGDVDDPAAAFSSIGSVSADGSAPQEGAGGRPPRERPAGDDESAEQDGEASEKTEAAAGGRPSPEERFAQADLDGDGLLSGDEIPARMKERLDSIDTNSDGSISKEELMEAMKRMSGRGGGGGGAGISQ